LKKKKNRAYREVPPPGERKSLQQGREEGGEMGNTAQGSRPAREDTGEASFDDDEGTRKGAPSFTALQRDVAIAQKRYTPPHPSLSLD
jgi:hypothetical protein